MSGVHWTELVDESRLTQNERLALAYGRLSGYLWDPILGPKPEGFDDLPRYTEPRRFTRKRTPCKSDFVRPAMKAIESIIGEAATSRFWWVYGLGRTEEEWFRWYISPDGPF